MKSRANKRTPKKVRLPPVSLGITVMEDLPFPVVYYPNHYGAFIAFAKDKQSQPYLCSCARSAVENYFKLHPLHFPKSTYEGSSHAPLSSNQFPNIIAEISQGMAFEHGVNESIFVPNLCHRCTMKTPSVRWCHEMYGVAFVQYYGWYINQTYFRLGIFPGEFSSTYLKEICPDEIQQDILAAKSANEKFRAEEARLFEMAIKSVNKKLTDNKITHLENAELGPSKEYTKLKREAAQLRRKFTSKVENIARAEFGFKKIGEGWVNETLLYTIITHLYPNQIILRHHRPDWLNRLELDIFLPELRLAFEYQGQQHFHAIKAWGGRKSID